jgi:hypothetical protein
MQPKIGLRPFPAPGDERRTLAACRETPRQGDDDEDSDTGPDDEREPAVAREPDEDE